jgi:transposase
MLTVAEPVEIYVCLEPTDMRKSFDSLAKLVEQTIRKEPLSGNLFVFINKRRNMVKILFWDRTRFCQHYKRLESGGITLPRIKNDGKRSLVINSEQLRLLLDGIDILGKVC